MSKAFNQVSADAIENIQVDAGLILNSFDPENPSAPLPSAIVCATTGGITATCVPTFTDFGEDIDNCPNNTKEMKRITGWDCTLAFTALNMDEKTIMLALSAATKSGGKITPNAQVDADTDFNSIWFVSEKVNDEVVAIELKDALSTGGFNYKTQKNGKGQLTVTLTGHISINDTSVVPMNFYVVDVSDII